MYLIYYTNSNCTAYILYIHSKPVFEMSSFKFEIQTIWFISTIAVKILVLINIHILITNIAQFYWLCEVYKFTTHLSTHTVNVSILLNTFQITYVVFITMVIYIMHIKCIMQCANSKLVFITVPYSYPRAFVKMY